MRYRAGVADDWSIRRVLDWTAKDFRERGLGSPRLDAELIPDEPERSIRDEFAGFQQSARISQGAELQRKTEAVVGTPPARDDAQICGTERPVSHQIWLALRQGEQLGVLRLGQNRAAGHRVRP